MKRPSHPKRDVKRAILWILTVLGLLAGQTSAFAYEDDPTLLLAQATAPAAPPARPRINPTNRTVTLTVPFKDGNRYVGDIIVTIGTDDSITFSTQRTLDLLAEVLDARFLEQLRTKFAGQATMSPEDFAGTGIIVVYDPQRLELAVQISPDMKASRSVSVSPLDRSSVGSFVRPAHFSAFMNIRGSVDYVHTGFDEGMSDPFISLDGAARIGKVVLEAEALWQPGANDEFQRLGTRAVVDDTRHLVRWTVGDLQTIGRGYQTAPEMAGVSAFRSYGVLQPQYIARPRGDQRFTLSRPSNVEIFVNGQLVRRLRLDPGNYNIRDFPFTQGANDIVVSIEDDTGARQTLRFNQFFDRQQLQPGLAEFGAYAGVLSQLGPDGLDYSNDIAFTGFYRRGITERLTLGANVQADKYNRLLGIEGVVGTPIGTLGFDLAASDVDTVGTGWAATATFQRLFPLGEGRSSSLNLFVDSRSEEFGSLGVAIPDNPYEYEVGGAYSHSISDRLYASLDARFSKGRNAHPDVGSYRATVGWRMTPRVGVTVSGLYDDRQGRDDFVVMANVVARLNPWSSVRADYDGRDERARLSYQAFRGQGVGSYNVTADLERTPDNSGLNASVAYLANRAELGLAHYSVFDGDFGSPTDQRTSFRLASAIGVADGVWSIGRPVYDSFAIVKPYESLRGTEVFVNPTNYGYTSSTGLFGTALEPSLSAYTERTVTVDAPGAPAGYDLGQGSFRVFSPYRGGYLFEVGSAYSVTAIGRLIGFDGKPVALLAGTATEVGVAGAQPIQIFTNRDGRFGASGLRAGSWRIEMPTSPGSIYILVIPERTIGVIRTGDLTPSSTGQ